MVVWYSWQNYIFLLFYYLLLCTGKTNVTKMADSGPYKLTLVTANVCANTSRPYMKNSPVKLEMHVVNSTNITTLSGNLTVLRNAENVRHRLKGFLWEDGMWKRNIMVNEMGCHSMLMHFIAAAMSIKYNRKKCMLMKGQYVFKNLDVNYIQHLWLSKMEYGMSLYRVEAYIPDDGTLYCYEYNSVAEPTFNL